MAQWLRDAYLELSIQKTPLVFEGLRPAEPYFTNGEPNSPLERNWEADAKEWEAKSRDWETLARILYLQTKVAASISSFRYRDRYHCIKCAMDYGGSYSDAAACLCKCRLLAMVDEAFRGELGSYPGHVEQPFPRKLPISYLCPF